MKLSLLLLATIAVSASVGTTNAQFTCTMEAQDEASCVTVKDSDSQHCAWCSVSGFGLCVSESQAETFEQTLPGTECDRYSGNDDEKDDDNAVPDTDDSVAPTDDAIPDDYWKCLKAKDEMACSKDSACTWCVAKAGFGLCMAGPSAESAADSDWFTCSKQEEASAARDIKEAQLEDPFDPACLVAFVQDQSEDGCTSALDSDGNACEWCQYPGVGPLCLNADQADIGSQLGITCSAAVEQTVQSPFDMACIMAFVQDQSQAGCTGAVDADGKGCEWCSYPGMGNMCLNADQATIGAQQGITCHSEEETTAGDPFDPTCIMAFLQDQSQDGCKTALDSDGNDCEWCTYPGVGNLCLNADQADAGSAMGVTCDTTVTDVLADPFDTDCIMAFMQDQSEAGCTSALDSDGNACEWCQYPGVGPLCLNADQANAGAGLGITCDAASSFVAAEEDEALAEK